MAILCINILLTQSTDDLINIPKKFVKDVVQQFSQNRVNILMNNNYLYRNLQFCHSLVKILQQKQYTTLILPNNKTINYKDIKKLNLVLSRAQNTFEYIKKVTHIISG